MNASAPIPFTDLIALHAPLKAELMQVLDKAIDGAAFIGGPMVDAFERQFAAYVGAAACSANHSGTDALRFALLAAGVGPGSIVYTVPNSFFATAEAIVQAGAEIRFVDVEADTSLMSTDRLSEALKGHVRRPGAVDAVVPVHLYGQCADMDVIQAVADEHGLIVIEDAAQAHGATYKGRKAGILGAAAAFSFYPGKNLGACGEAGAVTSNDAELIRRVSMWRDHGQASKANHVYVGYNGRLASIQAGFLSVKLPHIDTWNKDRQAASLRYDAAFAGDKRIRLTTIRQYNSSSRHVYAIHIGERDRVMKRLLDQGIGVALHYPTPIHLQPCFSGLGLGVGSFPVAEELAGKLLSLPLFPGMTAEQVDRVVAAVKDALA
jgi:dTDP-4-amino-4,6-dideoxygalactose transaminase